MHMIRLGRREATIKSSSQIKTYYQYLYPSGRFLKYLFSETFLDLMVEVSTADLIHTSASSMHGWNPRSLMTFQIADTHALPEPFKPYNAL